MENNDFIIKATLVITGISSFATFLASLFTLFNFLEMRKQRIQSHSPSLVLETCPIYIYFYNKGGRFFSFSSQPINEITLDESYASKAFYSKDFCIPIVNLGSPAKNITIEWSFEMSKMIKLIESIDKNNIFNLELTKNSLSINSTAFDAGMSIMLKNDLEEKEPFHLLTYNSKDDKFYIRVPLSYLLLFSIYSTLAIDFYKIDSNKDIIKYIDFDNIKCKVKFSDIHDKLYEKEYHLIINIFKFIRRDILNNSRQEVANGYLSIKKIIAQ